MIAKIRKTGSLRAICSVVLLLSLFLMLFPSSAGAENQPLIHDATVHPSKVRPGDIMVITAEVSDPQGIESVTADMGGIDTISLSLVNGTIYDGTWQAHWLVHDTEPKEYVSTILATNLGGETSFLNVLWNDWWDPSWSSRATITVSNSGSALTDYQIMVTVSYDPAMQADFDDIRFVDSDDTTALSHWRESYTPSSSAIFWVKVPSIPSGNKTIYVYYENAAASSASNGTATFDFFDDFSGDLSKWNIHIDTDVAITASYGNPAPSLEISGGTTSSPYGFAAIGSDATYTGFQDGIIEADIYPATVALPEIIFRGDYSANTGYKGRWDCRSGSETPWMKPPYSGWGGFGAAVARFGIANQWQKAKLVINGSTFEIYSNDNLKSTVTNTQYSGPGEIGLANHYGTYAIFDNVRVRKYASPEPTVTIQEGMPPYTSGHDPAPGAINVPIDTNIVVHVQDDATGVDIATIAMTVEGAPVTPAITGTPADYTLTYDPPADFAYLQLVDVTIDASDLVGNVMPTDSFSFTTQEGTPPYTVMAMVAMPTEGDGGYLPRKTWIESRLRRTRLSIGDWL